MTDEMLDAWDRLNKAENLVQVTQARASAQFVQITRK